MLHTEDSTNVDTNLRQGLQEEGTGLWEGTPSFSYTNPFFMFFDPVPGLSATIPLEYCLRSRTKSFLWNQIVLHSVLCLYPPRDGEGC